MFKKTAILIIILLHSAQALEKPKGSLVAYQFVDLKRNKVVLEHNPKQLMHPASTQKLFTAYFALKKLGPNYQFSNALYYEGEIANGTLRGNVILYFGANPNFSLQDIQDIFDKLHRLGIKKIKGDIIVDKSRYDREYYPPGWIIDDRPLCFSAPISPIIINKNCFKVDIINRELNYPKHIYPDIKIVTNKYGVCKPKLHLNTSHYMLEHCGRRNKLPSKLNIATYKPEDVLEKALHFYARKHNITFNKIVPISYPYNLSHSKLLASYNSQPLSELVQDFLLNSRNLLGEIFIKEIAYIETNQSGSTETGTGILTEYFINELGIHKFNIMDGSGLSRYNLIAPESFNVLLGKIITDKAISRTILDVLPHVSLDTKFKSHGVEVIAKTGTMRDIRALSGFITKHNKPMFYFTLVFNNVLIYQGNRSFSTTKFMGYLIDRLCRHSSINIM